MFFLQFHTLINIKQERKMLFCYQEATILLNIHKAQAAMNEKATQIFYFHKF